MSNTVTAYQTLENRDNIDEIEMDGPFECRRNDAWLGFGYYFWDTNIEWAHMWGRSAYERRKKEYVIGSCEMELGSKCFDLFGSVKNQLELQEAIMAMKLSGKIRHPKEALIPNIIEFLKNNKIFDYNSIRAADMAKTKKLYFNGLRKEHAIINQRVQICVIEKKGVLLSPFLVVYPEKSLT